MLRYFPFPSTFDLRMGTSPLAADFPVAEVDELYHEEVMLKRKLLKEDHEYYYKTSPVTKTAQWEVVEKVLGGLSAAHPEKFILTKDNTQWSWTNHLLDEKINFVFGDDASLPIEPLDWVGGQVQEDLLLLDAASLMQGGQLCFPSGWDIGSKFGLHFLEFHSPVPALMGATLRAANKLIEHIPAHKPIARTNWGFRITEQLDLSNKHTLAYQKLLQELVPGFTPENAGEKIFIRSERQTLSRLPASNFVLFTIHTYNCKVKEEAQDINHANAMLTFLRGVPAEIVEFKVMTPFMNVLLGYLEYITQNAPVQKV